MIKPMLAHKFDESRIDWNDKVFLQPKLLPISSGPMSLT